MRYFIHLGFDGSNFSGWQRQNNTPNTIQEIIEDKLSHLFKKRISAYGCGRTDAGVHASQFVFQIDLDEAPLFDLKFRLNKNLPESIAVFEIIEVEENQHCRHDAVARLVVDISGRASRWEQAFVGDTHVAHAIIFDVVEFLHVGYPLTIVAEA